MADDVVDDCKEDPGDVEAGREEADHVAPGRILTATFSFSIFMCCLKGQFNKIFEFFSMNFNSTKGIF